MSAAERVGGEDHSPIFRATAALGEVEVQAENRRETLLTHTRTDVEETAVRFLMVAFELATMARSNNALLWRSPPQSTRLTAPPPLRPPRPAFLGFDSSAGVRFPSGGPRIHGRAGAGVFQFPRRDRTGTKRL